MDILFYFRKLLFNSFIELEFIFLREGYLCLFSTLGFKNVYNLPAIDSDCYVIIIFSILPFIFNYLKSKVNNYKQKLN